MSFLQSLRQHKLIARSNNGGFIISPKAKLSLQAQKSKFLRLSTKANTNKIPSSYGGVAVIPTQWRPRHCLSKSPQNKTNKKKAKPASNLQKLWKSNTPIFKYTINVVYSFHVTKL